MIAAVIILGVLCAVLPILAVRDVLDRTEKRLDAQSAAHKLQIEETVDRAGENLTTLFNQMQANHEREIALMTDLVKAQSETISRQQQTIEETHSRLVLPTERAVADVSNSYREQAVPAAAPPAEEWPVIPEMATGPPELPDDLDTPDIL